MLQVLVRDADERTVARAIRAAGGYEVKRVRDAADIVAAVLARRPAAIVWTMRPPADEDHRTLSFLRLIAPEVPLLVGWHEDWFEPVDAAALHQTRKRGARWVGVMPTELAGLLEALRAEASPEATKGVDHEHADR